MSAACSTLPATAPITPTGLPAPASAAVDGTSQPGAPSAPDAFARALDAARAPRRQGGGDDAPSPRSEGARQATPGRTPHRHDAAPGAGRTGASAKNPKSGEVVAQAAEPQHCASAPGAETDAPRGTAQRQSPAGDNAPETPDDLIAALLAHQAASAQPAGAGSDGAAPSPPGVRTAAHARAGRAAAPRSDPPSGSGDPARAQTQAASTPASFTDTLAASRQAPGHRDGAVLAGTETPALAGAAATAAHGAPSPTLATPAPAAPEARLPFGPGHPEFATQLAAQLTTFVRNGVEFARIQLHPAEMGPLTVQIQLDGQAAQVHIAAERSDTRLALDAALPALAGSLREAGLTLAGGGVFQQPRDAGPHAGHQGGSQGSATSHGESDPPGIDPTAPIGARGIGRRRGVVDLVA